MKTYVYVSVVHLPSAAVISDDGLKYIARETSPFIATVSIIS